jgi:hypothetical protein
MANAFQFKRGLETNRAGETPAQGEPLWVTDTQELYVGDGSTAGGILVGLGIDWKAGTEAGFHSLGIDDNATALAVTIDPDGEVAIGMAAPDAMLHVVADDATAGSNTVMKGDRYGDVEWPAQIQFRKARGTPATPTTILLDDQISSINSAGWINGGWQSHAQFRVDASENWTITARGTHFVFETTAIGTTVRSEKMRITGDGYVGIGVTPEYKLHVAYSSGPGYAFERNSADVSPPNFAFNKSRGTAASPSAVLSGDQLANINFRGYKATGYGSSTASMRCIAAENFTDTASGGHLYFMTTPIGSVTEAERMRIDSNGNVGIGVTPADANSSSDFLQVGYGAIQSNSAVNIQILQNASYNNSLADEYIVDGTASRVLMGGYFRWYTAPTGLAGDPITFTERMRLDADGNLGIGTTPTRLLHVSGDTPYVRIQDSNATTDNLLEALLEFSNSTNTRKGYIGFSGTGNPNFTLANDITTGVINLSTGGAERMRIDSDGNVGIGTSTPQTTTHIASDASTVLRVQASIASAAPAKIQMYKSRGTVASPSAVLSGDTLGNFAAAGYKATAWGIGTARIIMTATQNFTDTACGTSMQFDTTPDGATAPVARMIIGQDGNVGIGQTAPTHLLHVGDGATAASQEIRLERSSTQDGIISIGYSDTNISMRMRVDSLEQARLEWNGWATPTNDPLIFADIANGERMRINTTGEVNVGSATTGSAGSGDVNVSGGYYVNGVAIPSGTVTSVSAGAGMTFTTITGSGSVAIDSTQTDITSLRNAALQVGYSSVNGYIDFGSTEMDFEWASVPEFRMTSTGAFHADGDITAYSTTTTSDRRYKKDIRLIDNPLDRIRSLNGSFFTWKRDGVESAGLIAQDAEIALPVAVKAKENIKTGEEYLALNYDCVVGLLVEGMKELLARVEALEEGNGRND